MKKILLSGATVLFCISMMAQNSVNLKMNLEKNKVYRLRYSSEQTVNQTINGNQQTVESKTNYTLSIKMVDATAGFMVAEVRFDTIMSDTNTMGKTVSISSARAGDIKSTETSDVLSSIMNGISKNAVYIKLDFTGKVIEIVNLKMLSDVILKDTSSIALTGPTAVAVKTQIQNMISDKAIKNMVEIFTHYLPGKQVSAGESWNQAETTNSGGMTLEVKTDFHLDGIKGNTASITAESNIKAAANAAPMVSGGATVTYDDLQGMSKSNMVIDIQTGMVAEVKAKTHIAGNLGVSGPGFSMQIPLDITGESKIVAIQ